jgi:hypothetical protein
MAVLFRLTSPGISQRAPVYRSATPAIREFGKSYSRILAWFNTGIAIQILAVAAKLLRRGEGVGLWATPVA